MNDLQEDPYQCIGYCQTDDAGYCLGCGRPSPMVAAPGVSDDDCMRYERYEMPVGDCQPSENRFPVDPLPQ